MVLYSSSPADGTTDGGLAQLGERLHGMQEVTGSIPVISTNLKASHRNVWCFCFYRTLSASFIAPPERGRFWQCDEVRDYAKGSTFGGAVTEGD